MLNQSSLPAVFISSSEDVCVVIEEAFELGVKAIIATLSQVAQVVYGFSHLSRRGWGGALVVGVLVGSWTVVWAAGAKKHTGSVPAGQWLLGDWLIGLWDCPFPDQTGAPVFMPRLMTVPDMLTRAPPVGQQVQPDDARIPNFGEPELVRQLLVSGLDSHLAGVLRAVSVLLTRGRWVMVGTVHSPVLALLASRGLSVATSGDAALPASETSVTKFKRAIYNGDVLAAEELVNNGVDVETRLDSEWTPLMYAASVANYNMAKLLLDRGASANFCKDQHTVLMAGCKACASEDKIVHCVELLLSRNADPNAPDRFRMTCLMIAAREGFIKLINLLVSYGAKVNAQHSSGYTALSMAVRNGKREAVLKLLQLGADKTIKTNGHMTPAELAVVFKHPQIADLLTSSTQFSTSHRPRSKEEDLSEVNVESEPLASKQSLAQLDDIQLLLHGLNLSHVYDILIENDITWNCLLTMEKEDLEKIGITEPEDQQKVLRAMHDMQLNSVDLETLGQLDDVDTGSEELCNFLISLSNQSRYLSETVQGAVSRFPQRPSELVLSLDPKKKAQAICNDLVIQIGDLHKEVTCLHNLLCQMNQTGCSLLLPQPGSHGGWRRRFITKAMLGALGATVLFLLSRVAKRKVHL
ncbi:ankyrin repeat, SAM and basic leucine zipper domain-containing protein 1 [Lampris incognitus]|uniref:ankyrin repeat, SAM and basic leucine zipper domain-containing protein 1 n=1 Tax=Lampris incognitus TaxID=2546036 RepID=UPI0024B5F7C5|nr:ankyrin repeat, SAM and basic leucine zipper domain-containing protein 1 [Lampris incognitus]